MTPKSSRTIQTVLAMATLCLLTIDVSYGQQSPTTAGRRGPSLNQGAGSTQAGASTARERPSTRRAIGPRSGRGSGAQVTVVTGQGSRVAPRVSTGVEGGFAPVQQRELSYRPVPEMDESVRISLTGPMLAVEFLDALALATGWNVAASPGVKLLTLDFWTNEVSPQQAVAILKFNEIHYEYDEETTFLFVMTKKEYLDREYGDLIEYEFKVRYAALSDIEIVLTSLLSPAGRLIADPVSSVVLVLDTRDNIDHMKRAVKEMDALRETKAFHLVYVDAEVLVRSVEALLTEGGRMDVDPRTNTLVVTDRPQRLERIAEVVQLLDHELETRTWVLDYADPEEVAQNLALLVPEAMGTIVVNEAIHQITVTGTPYRLKEVEQRIEAWDTKRRQVQIEAYLASASQSFLRSVGINWSYATTLDGDPVGAEVGVPIPEDTGSGIDLGTLVGSQRLSFLSDNFAAVIDTLDTSADATILAHPRITVQDGEEAVFENTTQVPFASSITTFGNNLNNSVNSNTRIEFIDVGTILRVTPRITSDDYILLDIAAEDSSFESVIIFANGQENTLPQKTQNKAQTQVLVRNQQTILLGGLRTTNFKDSVDRLPILGGLPLIGRVFRSNAKNHEDRELLIFLTPTIVDEGTQPEAIRLAQFDDALAETMRHDARTSIGRIRQKLNGGENELTVSIGQKGGLLAEAGFVSMEELRVLLLEAENPESKTLIIRTHPRAPASVAMEITEIAVGRGMKIQYDKQRMPFVPIDLEEVPGAKN